MVPAAFFSQQTRIESEVLGQIRQIGGQKAKTCSSKALLDALSPGASELDQRDGGQAVRLPQGMDFGGSALLGM